VVNAWRMIPASVCSCNSEIWRRWHYTLGVFFMEWTWPSVNTAWKSKHRRIQVHLTRCILSMVEDQFGDDDCISMTVLPAIKQGL
jgi:hypothetical protein